jgi:2-oxoisovalerate dehydrogenase E2 component (dihydrolipoyl transacylase)
VVEGTIGKWLKQPGDAVRRYEPLVEVVTDKVTMEVPSPVDGSLVKILAQEGETIPMGAPIAEVETADGEGSAAHPEPAAAPVLSDPTTGPTAGPVTPSAGLIGYLNTSAKMVGPTGGGAGDDSPPDLPLQVPAPATRAVAEPAQPHQPGLTASTPAAGAANGSPRLSPAVRRLAREHNIDLSRITGTGMGGRITRDDVLRYLESGAGAAVTTAEPAAAQPVTATPAVAGADEEYVALTPVRRMIAEAMVRSVTQIPHAWSAVEVDVTNLVTARAAMRESFRQREGVDLTYLPFVLRVLVESLKENPTFNASWGGDKIILKRRLNIGLAVAAPAGLVVPVIHNADRLSLSGLAHAVADLTQRARQNKLTLDDVQGGTFTLNNTGALGSTVSMPIINHPQAAIMTTEAVQKRPVVINDAIAIRSMMNLCLSFDHRINDGAESSAFIQSVKRRLESLSPDSVQG